MGEDKKADKKRKSILPKASVKMIISREYVGTKTVTEALIPIISKDARKTIDTDYSVATAGRTT